MEHSSGLCLIRLAVYAAVCGAGIPAAGLAAGAEQTAWSVSNRQVLVNSQPFLMRGVAYQPTPIGDNPSTTPPNGDYYTTNYAALYDRDFSNLRAIGANVVRIYGWNTAANHAGFLSRAWNGGTNPVYVLLNKWINPATAWTDTGAVAAVVGSYVALANNVSNHPAVLGFAIGNELNLQNGNGTNPAFWAAINAIAGAVRGVAPTKLVTTINAEGLSQIATFNAGMTNLDAWCLQIYRGRSFGSLFTNYAAASAKPMFISEFGIDAFDNVAGQLFTNNAGIVADYFADLWYEILTNRPTCSGGCFYSYSDEWWKAAGTATNHDPGGFTNLAFPDDFANEEWWGMFAVQKNGTNTDLLVPRAAYHKAQELWTAPAVALGAATISNRFAASFPRLMRRTDLTYDVQAADDLANWSAVARSAGGQATTNLGGASSVSETAVTNDTSLVTVRDGTNATAPSSRFMRLQLRRD